MYRLKALISSFFLGVFLFLSTATFAADWEFLISHSPWIPGTGGKFAALSERESFMLDSAKELFPASSFAKFFKTSHSYYLQPSCSRALYRWEGNKWLLISNSMVLGEFCNSYSFIQDDELFILGGYGFWQGNLDLIKIPLAGGKSEWVSTINQPTDYKAIGVFRSEKGVLNLFGYQLNARLSKEKMDYDGFFLDWITKTWNKLQITWDENFSKTKVPGQSHRYPGNFSVDLQDFGLIFIENSPFLGLGWYILDKKTWELYYLESPTYLIDRPFNLLAGSQNTFWMISPNLDEPLAFDAEVLVSNAVKAGKIEFAPVYDFGELTFFDLMGVLTMMLFLGAFTLYIYRTKKSPQRSAKQSAKIVATKAAKHELAHFFDLLENHKGKTISQATLDKLLEIDHLKNDDLRKVRRARLVKQLNAAASTQFGHEIIQRTRLKDDRRMMAYKIWDQIPDSVG